MDTPFKFLGKSHRILFHDPATASLIASRLYPGDKNAFLAAQYHILIDEACSRNPLLKEVLETLARLGRRRKSREKEETVIGILKALGVKI